MVMTLEIEQFAIEFLPFGVFWSHVRSVRSQGEIYMHIHVK